MTSATSFAGTLSLTSIPTSLTAPTRSTSRGPCRGWCEWPRRNTHKDIVCLFQAFLPEHPESPSTLPCRSKNPAFKEVLTRIEGHPDCRNLPMISFLILPMQRITRLPLLMDVSALLRLHSSTSSGITLLSLCYATVCLSVLPWLILHGLCSNLRAVCTTFHQSSIISTDLAPLSPFKCFFFFFFFSYPSSVSCFPRLHITLPLFLSLALLSSSSLPSSVSVSPGTLGFTLVHSEASGSWESLVSDHFFPQLSKSINILSRFRAYMGPSKLFWGFARECVFMWDICTICYWLSPWLPFCCRQSVRRHPKTRHNMKTVRGLCKESARCVRWGSRPGLTHTLD